jgi:large subunit ribosomal protein L4e
MSARPRVTIFDVAGKAHGNADLPEVLARPGILRHDIVQFVHNNIAKNRRQPYAVSRRTGHHVAAESWGTGRAVARIPRVGGGGTHRSGQGAYGNMCRGGRMFAPTKTFRRWHRHVNKKMRRYAIISALQASAVTALVEARGHRIRKIQELPLVVTDQVQQLARTKDAVAFLKSVKAYDDIEKVRNGKHIRAGVGKARNRRYVNRKGPLVVFDGDEGGWAAFRNIPGVDLCRVSALNLLQLAPGGHVGRFIIFSESAFKKIDSIYLRNAPKSTVKNTNITRVIRSSEIAAVTRPTRTNWFKKLSKQRPRLTKV